MDKERFQKQLDFILEVDKEKNILRQSHLSGYVRRNARELTLFIGLSQGL